MTCSIRSIIFSALVALGCRGTTETQVEPPPPARVARIAANIPSTLFGGDSLQVVAWTVGPTGDSVPGVEVTLTALTPAIATITPARMIHSLSDGIALFLAAAEGHTDTIGLQIYMAHVARVVAIPNSIGLFVGDSLDPDVDSIPFALQAFDAMGNEMRNAPVFLASSNQGIVTTSSYFYALIARRVGTAVLTATVDTASTTIQVSVTTRP